jgi:imidazolonepropionase-like amidohydrolase
MKYILRTIVTIAAVILIAGVVGYFILTPGDNIAELNKAATSPIWPKWSTPRPILLKNVTIADTKSGNLLRGMDVLIVNGKIRDILQAGTPLVEAGVQVSEAGVQVIEAGGKYLVPGYLNMHMHVIDQDNPSAALAIMLTNGITGFRQMSGSPELLKLRKEHGLPLEDQQPAMLAMPGSILTPVNTHSKEAAVENVRRQKAEGADFIKIGLLPPDVFFAVLSEAKRVGIPALGHVPGDVNMQAASDSGFRSIEHLGLDYGGLVACSTEGTELRAAAPIAPRILSSLPGFMDRLSMKLLQTTLMNPAVGTSQAEYIRISRIINTFSETKAREAAALYSSNDTWQCPTIAHLRGFQLAFLAQVQNDPGYRYLSGRLEKKHREVTEKYERQLTPQIKEELIRAYDLQLRLVKIYDSMGVKLLAGTDDNSGNALQLEFDQFAKAGLSPLRILQTATINAAEFLGRAADMGTVEQGKIADLVLLNANPIEDVRRLHDIYAVIRAGHYFSQKDLSDLKQRAVLSEQ